MAKRFEKALEAATEQTLVEPNWEGILECVDMIRGADVPVKDAILLIQKRYHSTNPHIAHHALLVLEACVKNCGKKFHTEIATREFMDDLKNLVIGGSVDKVKEKVLELIQCWSSAFRDKPEYKIVVDAHNLLKMNGFEFPALKEADAMFIADSAPDWVEGDNCYRCRTEFSIFTRRHHCRACGQIFCDKCSNKQMLLPQFGIEKRVRVCESCYDKKMNQKGADSKHKLQKMPKINWMQFLFGEPSSHSARDHRAYRSQQSDRSADEARERARIQELMDKEAEELQLALAISQSEAEAKERRNYGMSSLYSNGNGAASSSSNAVKDSEKFHDSVDVYRGAAPSSEDSVQKTADNEEAPIDSVLAKYLDREYWERKRSGKEAEGMTAQRATAPPPSEYSMSIASNDQAQNFLDSALATPQGSQITTNGLNGMMNAFDKFHLSAGVPNEKQFIAGEEEVEETAQFCKTLKDQVDIMDNRMRSNLLRGRLIVNDSAIHSLFAQLTNSHAEVLARMTKLEGDREYYETLQDHLAHIQEARQAVNTLREEHMRQKKARMMEEQQQRRVQMQHTLGIMRQKKHETLLYQRHLALQRFQEQEQQMQQRRLLYQQQQHQQPQPQQPQMMPSYPVQTPMFSSTPTSQQTAPQSQPQFHHQPPQPQQMMAYPLQPPMDGSAPGMPNLHNAEAFYQQHMVFQRFQEQEQQMNQRHLHYQHTQQQQQPQMMTYPTQSPMFSSAQTTQTTQPATGAPPQQPQVQEQSHQQPTTPQNNVHVPEDLLISFD